MLEELLLKKQDAWSGGTLTGKAGCSLTSKERQCILAGQLGVTEAGEEAPETFTDAKNSEQGRRINGNDKL